MWVKPPPGSYKMNWDVATNNRKGIIGIGAIMRDNHGQVIGTIQAKRVLHVNAFSREAYAMMMSVFFCKEISVFTFILEGDAMQVVNLLNGKQLDSSYGGLIVEDAKGVLNQFTKWYTAHVKREGNRAAHHLAQNALNLCEDLFKLEEIPVVFNRL
ncbi:uncharacterized protein LOC122303306 [Carya illinoinensis]|uniref:uncharacterized protein LOC122303306 n=1 Tax=Carya illinoinensis TaxID=32201 RepID=UPI001C719BCE|nr:uncharacterized protein LOC122303306 [Carya illinoinensis]